MGIVEDIAAAKEALAPSIEETKVSVAEAKSAILAPKVSDFTSGFQNTIDEAKQAFEISNPDPKRVVKSLGNVSLRADGTFQVVTADGQILENINKDSIPDFLAIEEQKFIDRESGASTNPVIGLINQGIDLVGKGIKGAFEVGADIFDIGTSAQTINQAVEQHNRKANTRRSNLFGDLKPVSDNAILDYKNLFKTADAGERLTSAQIEFIESESFKTLSALDKKIKRSVKTFDKITDVTEFLKTGFPTARADDLAISLAFNRIANKEGTWEAVKHLVFSDAGQLVKQGFESIPYMVAFTIGGPFAQTAILVALSKEKARETTATFITDNNREPTVEEQQRIDLFSAVSTVTEKFGDMAALKALPFARIARANDFTAGMSNLLPDAVKTAFRNTRFISAPATALAGEGLSGGITSAADQIALTGEVGDTAQVAFDVAAEAVGTVGGIGGLTAAKLATAATKGALGLNDPIPIKAEAQLNQITNIIKEGRSFIFGDTPKSKPQRDRVKAIEIEIQEAGEADTSALEAEKDKLIAKLNIPVSAKLQATITENLTKVQTQLRDAIATSKISPSEKKAKPDTAGTLIEDTEFQEIVDKASTTDTKAQADTLIELDKRAVTPPQKSKLQNIKSGVLKAVEVVIGAKESIEEILGSSGDGRGFTDEQLKAVSNPENAEFIKQSIKLNKLEEQLKRIDQNNKKLVDVSEEVRDGLSDRWTGLNTYRDEIRELRENVEDTVVNESKIAALEDKMSTHISNLQNKFTAFKDAQILAKKRGRAVVITSAPVVSGSRLIRYTIDPDAVATKKGQIKKKFTFDIHSNSGLLIDTLEKEVEHSQTVLDTVEAFEASSLRDAAIARQIAVNEAAQIKADIEALEFANVDKPASQEDIDAIPDVAPVTASIPSTPIQGLSAERKENDNAKIVDKKESAKSKVPDGGTPASETKSEQKPKSIKRTPETTTAEVSDTKQVEEIIDDDGSEGESTQDVKAEEPTSTESSKNFIEDVGAESFPTVITQEKLAETSKTRFDRAVKKAKGVIEGVKSIIDRISGNKEKGANLRGLRFLDLVKIGKELGIQNIPASAFVTPKTLKQALVGLKISPASADILTEFYTEFNKRYKKTAFDNNNTEFGNFAISQPLSLLHQDGKLPPQVVFGMMLGTLKWIQQNPSNTVFRTPYDREKFLYGGQGTLSQDETDQLVGNPDEGIDPLGHGYQLAVRNIGGDIASIMKFSANTKHGPETSIYFDNLIPALGLAALQTWQGDDAGAMFKIENKKWTFTEDYVKERIFNNFNVVRNDRREVVKGPDGKEKLTTQRNQFKHIMLNIPEGETSLEFSEGEALALKEIVEAIDADVALNAHLPQPKSSDDIVTSIDGSFGGVPKKIGEVLKQLQNVKWTAADSMTIAARLNKSEEGRDALDFIAGVEYFDDTYHKKERAKLKASNADKTVALDEVLKAFKTGDLKEFYFRYKLQNQHRILMQGNINPQQSKVTRYLLRSYDATTYTKDNINLFKLSVVANLGFEIDKESPVDSLAEFDRILKDDNVKIAIKAIQNIDAPGELANLTKALTSVSRTFESNMSTLNALTALSKGITLKTDKRFTTKTRPELKDTFESDAILEIDGISNGFAINVLQFPLFKDRDTLLKHLNQIGTRFGDTKEETTHKNDVVDVYVQLGSIIKNFFAQDTSGKANALREIYPQLVNTNLRDLVKYPFLIFLYGGQFDSIAKGVAKKISKDIYSQLNTLQLGLNDVADSKNTAAHNAQARLTYINEEIIPFSHRLAALNAFTNIDGTGQSNQALKIKRVNFVTSITKNKSQEVDFNDTRMIETIGELLQPAFKEGLTSMLGGTIESRQAVIQAGEILHEVFMVHYNKAYEEKAKKLNRTELTKKEITALIENPATGLKELLPQVQGALGDGEGSSTFIDLSKQKSNDNLSSIELVEYLYKHPTEAGKSKAATSAPRLTEFDSPGVGALIRQIINIDAAILTETLRKNPSMLPLHDAVMGRPADLNRASVNYGEFFGRFGDQVHILDRMVAQINKVREITKELDEKNGTQLAAEIGRNIKNNARVNQKANKPQSFGQLFTGIEENADIVTEAKEDYLKFGSEKGGITHNQLFIPRPEGTETPTFYEGQLLKVRASVSDALGTDPKNEVDEALLEFLPEEEHQKYRDNLKELFSLDNLPREKEKIVSVEDIGKSNIKSFFRKMADFSIGYYKNDADRAAHTSVLDTVLGKLAKGMDATTRIHLTTEHIDGITQGQYAPRRKAIRVSLQRQPPVSAIGQSPQEVYVHEVLHAMTFFAVNDDRRVGKRIEKLYNEIKTEIGPNGYKIFLHGIDGKPSTADIEIAKGQYRYVFNNPKNEKNRLSEFLAYSLTNKAMINYLSNRIPSKPVLKGFLARLQGVLDLVMEVFDKALKRAFGKTVATNSYMEMIAIVEQLVAIQSKHQSTLKKLENRTNKFLDKSDQKIRTFFDKQSLKIIKSKSGIKAKQVATNIVKVPLIALSNNAEVLAGKQAAFSVLSETLRQIVSEVGGGVLSKEMIEQLLHAKVNVSKARQQAETFTIEWFNKIWKSVDATNPKGMSVDTREALTQVLLRTDLSALRNVNYSNQEIADLIGNETKIKSEQRKILLKLRIGSNHKAIKYADELGNFIITGDTYLGNAPMNAYLIAKRHIPNFTDTTVELLDAYTTLAALKNIDSRQGVIVSRLAKAELLEDSNENGFIDMLDSHNYFKQSSLRDLFAGNPTQTVKGFIVERIDDLTSLETGTAEEAAQKSKAGLTEKFSIGDIPGVANTHNTLYVGRNMPPVPFASGAMSTTNQRNKGTTLREIFANDPIYKDADGNVDFGKISTDIKKFIKEETERAKDLTPDKKRRLRPVTDDRDNITDYRVLMNHATRRELLRPDLEIQNVFAHMNSGYVDRKQTIISDKKIVEVLVHEQSDMAKSYKGQFVNFLLPVYSDRYRRLPRAVRDYMDKFVINGEFLVREDVIDKVFGFKVKDLSQLGALQSPAMAGVKRFAGLTHYFIRQVVGYGKDRIVIAMPLVVLGNTFSNITQLTMRKIPLSYTYHKLIEGFQEFERYRDDTKEFKEIKHRKESKGIPDNSPEGIKLAQLLIKIENNKIHRMSAAGLNSLILEDVNDASTDGYFHRIRQSLKLGRFSKFADKVPTSVNKVAATMFMTKTSVPYQISKHIVQLTDFLARYVMIEHATKVRNVSFNDAMHDALNAFVLFDETLTPWAEMLDAIGFTSFLSYFLRNQRSSRQTIQTSPTGVGISAAVQYATGIPTLGNINSAVFGGDFSPNLLQLDDLFDEATNITFLDILADTYNLIFG